MTFLIIFDSILYYYDHNLIILIKVTVNYKLSNGHSPANLSNSSTRQNGHFGKLAGLDTFARHSPTILLGLARLAKGKFGKFYANLASLTNLASVG